MQFLLVSIVVALNVIAVLTLRYATGFPKTDIIMIGAFLSAVLLMNGFKFFLWGYIHKYFSLSTSYPMAAMFYPIMYGISIYYGEAYFEMSKVIGALFIFSGAILVNQK